MREQPVRRIIDIVYPLFFYYILYYCLQILFAYLLIDSFGSLFCLLLAAVICIPFMVFFYRRAIVIRNFAWPKGKEWMECVAWIIGIALLGVGANVLVSNLPLADWSEGYRKTSEILRDGNLWIRILTNAVAVPILEELLYRGIICGQIEAWGSVGSAKTPKPKEPAMVYRVTAVVVSAVIFGALHLNVIQFLYAFLMGLFLGAAYIRTHRIWVVIVAHGITNLAVLLMTMG